MARPHEVPHGWMHGCQFFIREGTEFSRSRGFDTGDRVKVVMVSRFGDCGVTKNLDAKHGYSLRLAPKDLVPTFEIPSGICRLCWYALADHDGACLKPVTFGDGGKP